MKTKMQFLPEGGHNHTPPPCSSSAKNANATSSPTNLPEGRGDQLLAAASWTTEAV